MSAVSVLVYSDQRMFCASLADSLEDEQHQVLAVDRRDELLADARRAKPRVCAIDAYAGDAPTRSLVEGIRQLCPDTRIVVLTSGDDDAAAWQAYDTHLVDSVVSKTHGLGTIRTAIDRTALGERVALTPAPPPVSPRSARVRLTARECEILRMLARGSSTPQILTTLRISSNTLRTHVQHLLNKLHAHTRAQAVQAALAEHLIVEFDEPDLTDAEVVS